MISVKVCMVVPFCLCSTVADAVSELRLDMT